MNIFRRVEQKYLITSEQYNALMEALGDKLVKDEKSIWKSKRSSTALVTNVAFR